MDGKPHLMRWFGGAPLVHVGITDVRSPLRHGLGPSSFLTAFSIFHWAPLVTLPNALCVYIKMPLLGLRDPPIVSHFSRVFCDSKTEITGCDYKAVILGGLSFCRMSFLSGNYT